MVELHLNSLAKRRVNMNFLKAVTIILVTFSVSSAFSQNVGSTTVPAEAWFCEIKEGYTMDVIREVSKGVVAFSK